MCIPLHLFATGQKGVCACSMHELFEQPIEVMPPRWLILAPPSGAALPSAGTASCKKHAWVLFNCPQYVQGRTGITKETQYIDKMLHIGHAYIKVHLRSCMPSPSPMYIVCSSSPLPMFPHSVTSAACLPHPSLSSSRFH